MICLCAVIGVCVMVCVRRGYLCKGGDNQEGSEGDDDLEMEEIRAGERGSLMLGDDDNGEGSEIAVGRETGV